MLDLSVNLSIWTKALPVKSILILLEACKEMVEKVKVDVGNNVVMEIKVVMPRMLTRCGSCSKFGHGYDQSKSPQSEAGTHQNDPTAVIDEALREINCKCSGRRWPSQCFARKRTCLLGLCYNQSTNLQPEGKRSWHYYYYESDDGKGKETSERSNPDTEIKEKENSEF